MPWSAHIDAKGVVAIHAALQKGGSSWEEGNDTDGVILLWGGDNHNKLNHDNHDWGHVASFNCNPNTYLPIRNISPPQWDSFCCGHAMMDDGRLLIAGGTENFPTEAAGEHSIHFTGDRNAASYSEFGLPLGGFFVRANMNFEAGHGANGGGRWYPSLVTLTNGNVYAVGGHPSATDSRHANNTPEIFSRKTNTWTLLPPLGANPPPSESSTLYPRLYLMNDGRVFCYSNIPGINYSFAVDPISSRADRVTDLPDPSYQGYDYPSVLLPMLPSDNYRMRVMLCGNSPCQMLELGLALESPSSSVTWRTVSRDFGMEGVQRVHSNATLLPDGRIVLTGGADKLTDYVSTGANPEVFSPTIGIENGRPYWAVVSVYPGSWTVEQDPATILRNYHSTALLLPDGRIWTAGGNKAGQPGAEPDPAVQEQIEIYTPFYAEGPRPNILTCDEVVKYDNLFFITMAGSVSHNYIVSLMRCGNCTHAWNSGQRNVWCDWTEGAGQNLMTVRAPPNGNVAPPGWWMVFVLDELRRPCVYAKFILLGL